MSHKKNNDTEKSNRKGIVFMVKCLNLVPRPIQKIIGYSSFGSYLLRRIKRSNSKTPFSIDNDLKINLELSNPHSYSFQKSFLKTFLFLRLTDQKVL